MLIRRVAANVFGAAAIMMILSIIAFSVVRFAGDPVEGIMAPEAAAEDVRKTRQALGYDAPISAQYVRFAAKLLEGDLGVSLWQRQPVATMLLERAPATIELAVIATLLGLAGGTLLGLCASVWPNGWIGRAMMTLSVIGIAVPTFLLAVILVWIFSIELGWLPAFGRGQTVAIGYWSTGLLTTSGVTSLILPVATLALYQTAWTAQLVFSQMHSALRAPHMLPARARSFSEWRLATRHALPNSLGPVISLTGLQLSHALTFAIVTESIFQWPGLGALFVEAVMHADLPVISAYIMMTGAVFVALSGLVDILNAVVDPRLLQGQMRGGGA